MVLESFEKVTAVFSLKALLALEVKDWKITHLALLVMYSTVINIKLIKGFIPLVWPKKMQNLWMAKAFLFT